MFSSVKVVAKRRKAIESLYIGTCTVTVKEEYEKPNGATGHHEVVALDKQPCKLSFSTTTTTVGSDTASIVAQVVKLFIAPEVDIPPGSKITVTQNGITTDYARSGVPAVYDTHQEIMLELFERYA